MLFCLYKFFRNFVSLSVVVVNRVAGFPLDVPLAFTITMVMRVVDSTYQIRTWVNEDAQSDLDMWCGRK